ncbi:MAG TPA: amino acid adenylation domain-containing protein, partial [Thermoanaerobaculia bacterium]|nr:amino acid adenylation domain-containing protein [Thermoanaerobaculia bacterium]
RELAGFATPTPLGIGSAAAASAGLEGPGRRRTDLSVAATDGLRSFARRYQLTLNTLVQGAWGLLLHRYSGEPEVVFGAVTSGRSAPVAGIEEMVGLFINTLPARVSAPPTARLAEWLQRLQERQAEMRQYEHSPLSQVHGWSEVPRGQPLFDSILVFENYPFDESVREQAGQGLGVRQAEVLEQTNFPLTVAAIPRARLGLQTYYDPVRCDGMGVERMLHHLESLLAGMSAHPEAMLDALPLLAAAERHQLLAEWNGGVVLGREEPCLHRWFAAQVARTPDAVAVVCADERLTYAELDARANRLARRLRRLGVEPEARVGICVERSLELVVGLLGILKAGGAYVPLDPSYPRERLEHILRDALGGSSAPVLLTEEALVDLFLPQPAALQVICLDRDWETIAGERGGPLADGALPDGAAYVIYTSGSTGGPKGVLVTHRNAARLFAATHPWFGFDTGDVWTLFHSYAFDFSVWELWGALLYGGRLVVVPHRVSRSPEDFWRLLVDEGVTVLNQTPSAFRQLVEAESQVEGGVDGLALRWVIFGGEALDPALLEPWLDRHGAAGPRLVNMYGITETTVHVTYRPLSAADLRAPRGGPIGGPIPDLRVDLLDPSLRPVPFGLPGEVYVGGAGLARGYLGRPELTAARFVPDPFGALWQEPGARLYKTGDLARYQQDGDLIFLGRADDQVKIRGFRIELGEIEAALAGYPGVQRTVVLVRRNERGEARLVACVVLELPGGGSPAAELRRFLKDRLPEHMLPASFIFLAALPLLPNGKVDRRALARLEAVPEWRGAAAGSDAEVERTPVEEVLAGIWEQVLGLDRVGAHDNFFELGGDSILSIQVISRARQAGLHLAPRHLFEHPTVAGLAAVAEASSGRPVDVAPVAGPVPLTPIQRWLFEQDLPHVEHFNQALLLEVAPLAAGERLDPVLVRRAVELLPAHHDALRLRF